MKIKPLEKDAAGRYDLEEIPEKLNEVISFLNNSFLTLDPDTDLLDVSLSSLTDIAVDRLTPLSNERQIIQGDLTPSIESSIFSDIRCPKCGAKHFMIGPSSRTCVYYPPLIKDGVNINPDRNATTTTYICQECGNTWEEIT